MERYKVPRVIFINKLDRAGANPEMCLNGIRERLRLNSCLLQLPIGIEDTLKGIIDVVTEKAYTFEGDWGINMQEVPVPEDSLEELEEKRFELIETIASLDDELAEKYLEDEEITIDDLKSAIRRQTLDRNFVPILMGSAYKNKGIQLALDGICDYLPHPDQVQNFALDPEEEKV